MSDVSAISCSDIHFSHTVPAARAAEPNWYAAMKRPMDEIRDLMKTHGIGRLLCAGDIWDKWNAPPELINFVQQTIPDMYAVYGQHDLPNHSVPDLHRSAYRTLELMGKVVTVRPNSGYTAGGYSLHGFPWNEALVPAHREGPGWKKLAMVHRYIWTPGKEYPGASVEKELTAYTESLRGYDVALFGDNHKGFMGKAGDCVVFNHGTLLRRKLDEIHYRPQVALIHADGTVEPYFLDTSKDRFIDPEDAPASNAAEQLEAAEFLQELSGLAHDSLDFRELLLRRMDEENVSQGVREKVLLAVG